MPRKIRDITPGRYYLITIRTNLAQIWMLPGEHIEATIGGIMARYQEIYNIKIYAYAFLGNHYHIVCSAPSGGLDQFFENVNREIARRVNRYFGRIAKFWARPYDAAVILNEDDLLEAVIYTVTNPVRHGLVRYSRSWPSLGCYHHCLNETDRRFSFTHYSIKNSKGEYFQTVHNLKISRLPQFSNLKRDEYKAAMYSYLTEREDKIANERFMASMGFLGAKALREQKPGSLPRDIARKKSPICYTRNLEVKKFYKNERKRFLQAYKIASIKLRAGLPVDFPPHCYKPPMHKVPKRVMTPEFSAHIDEQLDKLIAKFEIAASLF
jgi:putative transposase